ncbi:MAG: MBL fold metallo-hydrolase [Calditrichaeota bacterium]|nr:MAG: MBL fold metallo-hydrolase [Calditrichota bacterium]
MALVEQQQFEAVQAVRIGRFTRRFNTTVLVYRLGNTLIDCGPPNQWKVLQAWLEAHPPQQLLLTHHHEDHCGNAAALKARLGVRVLAPEASLPFLRNGFPIQLYRQIVWGVPEPVAAEALPEKIELPEGFTLIPIPAPGHAPDMTCFLEPNQGWLFTGDLYISDRPQYLRKEENPHQEMESLRHVLSYNFQVVFCAHRGMLPQGREAIQRKLDYLVSLRQQAQSLHRQGYSLRAIQHRLLGRESEMSWITMGHFSKRNLIEALLQPPKENARKPAVEAGLR